MRKNNLKIKVGKQTIVLGTKMYPVPSKANLAYFYNNCTENLGDNYKEFLNKLDEIEFRGGECFHNTLKAKIVADHYGINATYYSGWLFVGLNLPTYHAWLEIDGNVLDTTVKEEALKLSCTIDTSDPDWREKYAPQFLSIERKPVTQSCVIGKVPNGLAYIGAPDTVDDALARVNKLAADFPYHPCFTRKAGASSELKQTVDKYRYIPLRDKVTEDTITL